MNATHVSGLAPFGRAFAIPEPVTRWVSTVEAPVASRFALESHYLEAKRNLSPGMVLLSHRRLQLGNVFLPGFWKHAAIYAPGPGRDGADAVVHATIRDGVTECGLRAFVLDKDGIAILRPKVGPERLARIAQQARRSLGIPYNFGFQANDARAYYCSELVFDCLKAGVGREPFPLRRHWGGTGITANDLYEQRRFFEVVYEFRHGPMNSELAREPDLVRTTWATASALAATVG